MLLDTEAAVMANFEFLSNVADVDMDEDDISDDADIDPSDELETNTSKFPSMLTENIVMKDEVDAEAEDVLNELNLLTESADSMVGMEQNWNRQAGNQNRMKFDKLEDMEENIDSSLGLGK